MLLSLIQSLFPEYIKDLVGNPIETFITYSYLTSTIVAMTLCFIQGTDERFGLVNVKTIQINIIRKKFVSVSITTRKKLALPRSTFLRKTKQILSMDPSYVGIRTELENMNVIKLPILVSLFYYYKHFTHILHIIVNKYRL